MIWLNERFSSEAEGHLENPDVDVSAVSTDSIYDPTGEPVYEYPELPLPQCVLVRTDGVVIDGWFVPFPLYRRQMAWLLGLLRRWSEDDTCGLGVEYSNEILSQMEYCYNLCFQQTGERDQ